MSMDEPGMGRRWGTRGEEGIGREGDVGGVPVVGGVVGGVLSPVPMDVTCFWKA